MKTEKQQKLVEINNLCSALMTAIERHYDAPTGKELISAIELLEKELRDYLNL